MEMISKKNCTIKNLLNFLKNKTVITLEKRDKLKYRTYGVMNQGEFSEYVNPVNNKTWKVIIPGYEDRFKEKYVDFKSIIGKMRTNNFNRIRIGIGSPSLSKGKNNFDTITHVLVNISQEEKPILDQVFKRVIESLEQLNTKKEEYIINELNSFNTDQI